MAHPSKLRRPENWPNKRKLSLLGPVLLRSPPNESLIALILVLMINLMTTIPAVSEGGADTTTILGNNSNASLPANCHSQLNNAVAKMPATGMAIFGSGSNSSSSVKLVFSTPNPKVPRLHTFL